MQLNLNLAQIFQSPFVFIKIAALLIILLYLIFTIVVLTQVNVMNKVITEPVSSTALKTIAIANVILAISLFLIAFVIL